MAELKFSCPQCSQHLSAPPEAAGCAVVCPACQNQIQIPALTVAPTVVTPRSGAAQGNCAICLSPMAANEATTECPECHAPYHSECWTENGGCAVYGCQQVPIIEQRQAIEIPVSYWGQENKPCPSCGMQILAAAVRCRHCGATFTSARPQDTHEFERSSQLQQQIPHLRRRVLLLFMLCVVPCVAPLGAIIMVIWHARHREELAALPSLYPALCKLGMIVGFGQTAAMVITTALFAVFRTHG